jgi:GNAT superfamily N-acetyltransferase
MLKSIKAPVTIRPATRSDCRAICRMIEELAKHHGDVPRISEDVLRDVAFGSDPWLHLIVAERFERPVAYAGLQRSLNLHFGEKQMDIHHLFVAPELRGRGIARQLIAASKEMALEFGCAKLTVSTQTENLNAQRTYFGTGFTLRKPEKSAKFKMKLAPEAAQLLAS